MAEEDLVATKLMANADRYADESLMSRDIIDLSMLTPDGTLSAAGVAKARIAYGDSIDNALARAKVMLLERDGRAKCMATMKMQTPRDDLRSRIERLKIVDAAAPPSQSSGA